MMKGPGLYTDIGKKARDLLYRDYKSDYKLTITAYSPTGVVSTAIRDVPGLNAIIRFVIPAQRSIKCEVQYLDEYVGICIGGSGLGPNTVMDISGVVGTNSASIGIDASFDGTTKSFTKYNAGLSFSNNDLIAAFTLNDKGDTLNASYYHKVKPLTNTFVGVEVNHSFSTSENTITVGTQHSLDPLTTVKGKVNNYGVASALIQHEWRPNSVFTLSGEVDRKAIDKSAKFGLSLTLTS